MITMVRLVSLVIPIFVVVSLVSPSISWSQGVGTVLGSPNSLTPSCANTWYIDYESGNDASAGTRQYPWKSHPYMQSWTGHYSHTAGDCFIFKGGVVWPAATLTLNIATAGNSSSYDYYGVDRTWYIGERWKRPIFDAQGTVPYPANQMIHIMCDSSGFEGYVTIDSIEIRGFLINNTAAAAGVLLSNCHDVMINNVDIHDWQLTSNAGSTDANNRGGVGHGVSAGTSIARTVVQNSHIHNEKGCLRATIIMARRTKNVATVTVSAPVIANWIANGSTKIIVAGVSNASFNTGADVQNTTDVSSTTFSYFNSGPDVSTFITDGSVKSACGVSIQNIQTVAYNEVHGTAQFILHGGMDVHDNYVHDNWGTYCNCGSTNNLFIDGWDGAVTPTHNSSYVYRNKIVNSNLGTSFYPVPCTNNYASYANVSIYFFNNVMIWTRMHTSNYAVNIDPIHCGTTSNVTIYVLNNIFRLTSSDRTACGRITPRPGNRISNLSIMNNHCIFDGEIPYQVNGEYLENAALIKANHTETNASATANGYTESNLYMQSSAASPTAKAGVNLTNLCSGMLTALCQDINLKPRQTSGNWDIGASIALSNPPPSFPQNLKVK